jgi:hypothetical protein
MTYYNVIKLLLIMAFVILLTTMYLEESFKNKNPKLELNTCVYLNKYTVYLYIYNKVLDFRFSGISIIGLYWPFF